MAWVYHQSSGVLMHGDDPEAIGYAGYGVGKNSPAHEHIRDVGPIPKGLWYIKGPPLLKSKHGPFVLRLSPAIDTVTYGRSGFLLHPENAKTPGLSSHGCIVLATTVIKQIWASRDWELEVEA